MYLNVILRLFLWPERVRMPWFMGHIPMCRKNSSNVNAIFNMKPPMDKKSVQKCIGLINYYRNMWPKRSHVLKQLMDLTSNRLNFKYIFVEN